jgi:hypothetical protein
LEEAKWWWPLTLGCSSWTYCNKKERGMENIPTSQIQMLNLRLLQHIFCHSNTIIIHWFYCSNKTYIFVPKWTSSNFYHSVPFGSTCSVHITIARNNYWDC